MRWHPADEARRAGATARRPNGAAVAALRTLLRVAPGFVAFQTLDTVHLVEGRIRQLMISR
jgi:hypothetical protein